MTPVRYVIEFSGKTAALGALADSAHEAAAAAASLTRALSTAEGAATSADAEVSRFHRQMGRIKEGADGASASLDGYSLSAEQLRRRSEAAAKGGQDLAARLKSAAETMDQLRGAAGLTDRQIEALATSSARLRAESEAVASSGRMEAQRLADLADKVEARARAEAEAGEAAKRAAAEAAAAAKAAAAAEKAAQREVSAAEKALAAQRDADERVRLGNIRGRANQEIRAIDALIQRLRERNALDEESLDLLTRRRAQVEADADRQEASIRARGVAPDAFGVRGTRTTTIGSGVLSSYFDRLFAMGGGGAGGAGGVSLERLQQAAGKADTALKGLAGAVGVFSPGAERAAIAAGDLVGALEFALTPAGAAAAGLLAAAGAASAFAVGAVAAVRAADGLAKSLDGLPEGVDLGFDAEGVAAIREANVALDGAKLAVSAIVVALAEDLAPAVEDGARVLAGLGVAAARAAGAAGDSIGRIADAVIQGIADTAAQLVTALVAPVRILALAASVAERISGATGVGGDAAAGLRGAVEALQGAVREGVTSTLRNVGEGYRLLFREAIAGTEPEVEALFARAGELRDRAATGRTGGAAGATETPAPLVDEDLIAALLDSYAEGVSALERLRDIQADTLTEGLSASERLTLEYQRRRDEINALADAAAAAGAIEAQAQREAALAAVNAAEARERAAAEEEARAQARADRARRVSSIVGGAGQVVSGGGPGSMLAGAGQIAGGQAGQALAVGAAVAGALGALGQLGASGLQARGEENIDAIVKGIEALPEVLVRVLPALGKAIVVELVPALLRLPFEIARELASALADFFERINPFDEDSREARRERRQERRERRRARRGLASGASYVPEDGWTMLHRGEVVVPASGAVSQSAAARTVAALGGGAPRMELPLRPVGEAALIFAVERGRRPFGRIVG